MNITLIQSELAWENPAANLKAFGGKVSSIDKTDLIILPEMFPTGFSMNASSLAETIDGPAVTWMKQTAMEKDCAITGSVIIREGKSYFNRLIWAGPHGEFRHYDKRHLFSYAAEEKTYTAGKQRLIIDYRGWRIFPLICYDLRFPVWSRRNRNFDYDLLIYVANWPERRNHAWKQLLIARAIENQSYVAAVNRVGNDGNQVFHSGDSGVIDFKGVLMTNLQPGKEGTETVKLHKEELELFRDQFAFGADADDFTIHT